VAAWNGPRHRSWLSDTNLSLCFAIAIVVAYFIWELVGTAPQGMVTLVGLAGGALLGGLSGDKRKREAERDQDVKDAKATAQAAAVVADRAAAVAEVEHPETAQRAGLPPNEVKADGGDHD
jgi:hypothetical protein